MHRNDDAVTPVPHAPINTMQSLQLNGSDQVVEGEERNHKLQGTKYLGPIRHGWERFATYMDWNAVVHHRAIEL